MSIINDALKKAEQFRKWNENPAQPKVEAESSSATAVLEETLPPPPPKVQKTVSRPRVIAQSPLVFHDARPAQPAVTFTAPSSKSFLVVSMIGVSILVLLGFFLLLSNFSANEKTILRPKIENYKSQPTTEPIASKTSISAQAVKQETIASVPEPMPAAQAPVPIVEKTVETKNSTDEFSQSLRSLKSHYQLTGIYTLNDRERYAFINGKVLEVGGTINGAKIMSIEQNDVTLKRGNRIFVLTMP